MKAWQTIWGWLLFNKRYPLGNAKRPQNSNLSAVVTTSKHIQNCCHYDCMNFRVVMHANKNSFLRNLWFPKANDILYFLAKKMFSCKNWKNIKNKDKVILGTFLDISKWRKMKTRLYKIFWTTNPTKIDITIEDSIVGSAFTYHPQVYRFEIRLYQLSRGAVQLG